MLDEQVERLRARVTVIEHLVISLFSFRHQDAMRGDPRALAAFRSEMTQIRANLAGLQSPGLEPALGDLRAAEAQSAADEIVGAIEQAVTLLGQARPG
ncbi:MAG: hypothetical protein ACK4TP_17445 [Hyphomicrobium sp.]